jgi:cytochrome c5
MVIKGLKIVGGLLGVALLGGAGFYGWAVSTTNQMRAEVYEVHTVDIPVPYPLTEAEVADLRAKKLAELAAATPAPDGVALVALATVDPAQAADPLAGVDLNAIALENAVARGEHLVEARYGCQICHGGDLSGGTMVDSPVTGTLLGLNLTGGKGSPVADFKPSDWERLVRHGVRPDGTPVFMPSKDYAAMSDQELSDIIAYIQSQPKVDNDVPLPVLGPLFNVLTAVGKLRFSAQDFGSITTHLALPPPAGPTAEFGEHLSHTCTGCHGADYAGGPVEGGDPAWPPAPNLTQAGVGSWTFEEFDKALRTGTRKDGAPMQRPMSDVLPMLGHTTPEETRALWEFFRTLPPKDGK